MQSLYILIPIAIFLVFLAVCIFIWAVNANQFEDLEKQGMRVLFDEDKTQDLPIKKNDSSL
jgi:cbb3-type cytochrome oxidase maturation protein